VPGAPRLDAPGTLRQVIIRSIENRSIVDDDQEASYFKELVAQAAYRVARQLTFDKDSTEADELIQEACSKAGIGIIALRSESHIGVLPKLRRDLAQLLVHELGLTRAETACRLGVTASVISQILRRTR